MEIVGTTYPNEHSLAIRLMGAQQNGALLYGNAVPQVPYPRNRLFH